MTPSFEQPPQMPSVPEQPKDKKQELSKEQLIQRLSELSGLTVDEVKEIETLSQEWGFNEQVGFNFKRADDLMEKYESDRSGHEQAEKRFKELTEKVEVALRMFEESHNIVGLRMSSIEYFDPKKAAQFEQAYKNSKDLSPDEKLDHTRLSFLADGKIFEKYAID